MINKDSTSSTEHGRLFPGVERTKAKKMLLTMHPEKLSFA
jgi:hypothetical protein